MLVVLYLIECFSIFSDQRTFGTKYAGNDTLNHDGIMPYFGVFFRCEYVYHVRRVDFI